MADEPDIDLRLQQLLGDRGQSGTPTASDRAPALPYFRLAMAPIAMTIESATSAPSAPSQLTPTVLRT